MKTDKMPQVIVCAAIRNKQTGKIVCGARHGNCLNACIGYGIDTNPSGDTWEMGFVDQDQEFLTRTEAWVVADKMGQIRRPFGLERHYDNQRLPNVGDTELLFSENLY